MVAGIGCPSGENDRVRRHLYERRHGSAGRVAVGAVGAAEPAGGRGAERRGAAGHEVGLLLVQPVHGVDDSAVAELELAGAVQGADGILWRVQSPSSRGIFRHSS